MYIPNEREVPPTRTTSGGCRQCSEKGGLPRGRKAPNCNKKRRGRNPTSTDYDFSSFLALLGVP